MDHLFLVMWCCEGLECVVDLTEKEKQNTMKVLKGEKPEGFGFVTMLTMRARANTQRAYEIYTIWASPGTTRDDLIKMFTDTPQQAADLVRERGSCMYSDRKLVTRNIV